MKQNLIVCSILAVSFFLMGCPYETKVPIDQPGVKYPAAMIGKWKSEHSSSDIYIIERKDQYRMSITKVISDTTQENKPEVYEAFLSEVNGIKFLNLLEINKDDPDSKKYTLYKLETSSGGTALTLSAVTENIDEQFNSSAELKKFIAQNMNHSFFFDKDQQVFTKIE